MTQAQANPRLRAQLLQRLADGGMAQPMVELAALWRARSGDLLPLNTRSNLTPALTKQLLADVARRANGEPVARILGAREFYSRHFRLNNACLIPRNDSETMVEALLKTIAQTKKPLMRIRELGCGSGCLVISLVANIENSLPRVPKLRLLSASDKSLQALSAARENAVATQNLSQNLSQNSLQNSLQKYSLPSKIRFSHADWLNDNPRHRLPVMQSAKHYLTTRATTRATGCPRSRRASSPRFDMIFANPPYVRRKDRYSLQREVQCFEPPLAIDGGFDGLASLRLICIQARKKLRVGGLLLLEHAPEQTNALAIFAKGKGYDQLKVFYDISARSRVTLLKRRRSNKPLDSGARLL